MLCSDTNGAMPAIHISKNTLDLAVELETIINAIETLGQGEGQIIMKVQPNRHIPWIDWTFRKFFPKKHRAN